MSSDNGFPISLQDSSDLPPKTNSESDTHSEILLQSHYDKTGSRFFHCCGKKRRRLDLYHSTVMIVIYIIITVIPVLFLSIVVPLFCNYIIIICFETSTFILLIMSIYLLFEVSTTSPGYMSLKNKVTLEEYNKNPPIVEIKGEKFNLRYCETCCIIREPRSFHCRICDRCIIKHDHHCDFVANCIGKNNFNLFFFFVLVTDLLCITVLGGCIWFYIRSTNEKGQFSLSFFYLIINGIIAFVSVIFTALLTYLLCYHIYLISSNETTNESMRNKYNSTVFDKGCKSNWRETLCIKTISENEDVD